MLLCVGCVELRSPSIIMAPVRGGDVVAAFPPGTRCKDMKRIGLNVTYPQEHRQQMGGFRGTIPERDVVECWACLCPSLKRGGPQVPLWVMVDVHGGTGFESVDKGTRCSLYSFQEALKYTLQDFPIGDGG